MASRTKRRVTESSSARRWRYGRRAVGCRPRWQPSWTGRTNHTIARRSAGSSDDHFRPLEYFDDVRGLVMPAPAAIAYRAGLDPFPFGGDQRSRAGCAGRASVDPLEVATSGAPGS